MFAEAFEGQGFSVWWDAALRSGEAYDQVTEKALREAKAVVVLWSPRSVASRWVRSEATLAHRLGTLVPVAIEACERPVMFELTQTAELAHWTGDPDEKTWRAFLADVRRLVERDGAPAPRPVADKPAGARKLAVCVLPFVNMSGDPEQEYFSDGISEDIITDLSKVSALSVVARNTAFNLKGKGIDVPQIARQLNVGHVLEGSVRKSGNRVRITAQLIDGAAGDHVWAERYDRDLTDIFALQDEISEAIVGALKLKLLPEEKEAIEQRGTTNPEAYNLYLMARQRYVTGNRGDVRGSEVITRLCRRATQIDPGYARAWALMALSQTWLFFYQGAGAEDGLAAAERALALDPDLAEAHAVRAKHLYEQGSADEAFGELELALRGDPESREVNEAAGDLSFRCGRLEDAIRYYEKASAVMESDYGSSGMLITCYTAMGDPEGALRAARMTLDRAEKAVAKDQSNGSAMGFAANALAALGETERAKEWIDRSLLIDPDNWNMRYNFACVLSAQLKDTDAALDLIGPFFAVMSRTYFNHAKADPDLDPLREDLRFKTMLEAAEKRLAAAGG